MHNWGSEGVHGPIHGGPLQEVTSKARQPRLLGGARILYREVLTNHGAGDVGEQRELQPSYGGFKSLWWLLLSYQSGYTENDDDPRLILGFLPQLTPQRRDHHYWNAPHPQSVIRISHGVAHKRGASASTA